MSATHSLLAEFTSGDDARAEAAAAHLARKGRAALPALSEMLGSTETDCRWWAVRTLAEMDEPRSEWIIRALGDDAPEVRAAAALALAEHPDGGATSALVEALGDRDGLVGSLCVNALRVIGKPAVPALLEAYPDANPRARILIMRTLAAIRDHRAIRLMLTATEDPSAMLNYWASTGLDSLGLNMVYLMPE